jgi:hypothetical protein
MTRYLARIVALSIACAIGSAEATAFARDPQPNDGSNRAAAEALFKQGKELMGKRRYSEACEKLDASNQLDAGIGTLLYLGDCYEKSGKLASAWAAFEEAASLANGRGEIERAKVATDRAAALEPRLPQIVLTVEGSEPGLEIRRNSELVAKALWGTPLPTDAGEYEISARAPDHESWSKTIKVTEAHEPLSVVVPKLKRSVTTSSEPAPPVPAAQTIPDTQPEKPGSSQRTVGLVVGGVGVLALIADGIFTILAASKNSASKDNCSKADENICNPDGVAQREDASSFATIASITGAAGGIVLASGAVIYFTAPSGETGAPSGAMVQVGGHF